MAGLIGDEMSQAWEELDAYRLSRADAFLVVERATGCTVTWTRRDGHPLAVWVWHALLDGEVLVTTTENRPKTAAWRRDPRTSMVFAAPGIGAVTLVGRVSLTDETALRRRFLEALCDKAGLRGEARTAWLGHMDTAGRLTGRLAIEKIISFDERKLGS